MVFSWRFLQFCAGFLVVSGSLLVVSLFSKVVFWWFLAYVVFFLDRNKKSIYFGRKFPRRETPLEKMRDILFKQRF